MRTLWRKVPIFFQSHFRIFLVDPKNHENHNTQKLVTQLQPQSPLTLFAVTSGTAAFLLHLHFTNSAQALLASSSHPNRGQEKFPGAPSLWKLGLSCFATSPARYFECCRRAALHLIGGIFSIGLFPWQNSPILACNTS